jgi:hypothetical protein
MLSFISFVINDKWLKIALEYGKRFMLTTWKSANYKKQFACRINALFFKNTVIVWGLKRFCNFFESFNLQKSNEKAYITNNA